MSDALAPSRLALRAPWWPSALGRALTAWAAHERGRFALWLPVAMIAGVVAYFYPLTEPPAWAGPAVLAPAVAGTLLSRRLPWVRAAFMALAAAAIGFASASYAAREALPVQDLPRTALMLDATVRAVEIMPSGGRRMTLENVVIGGEGPFARRIRIRLRATDDAPLVTGDRVHVRAMARPPASPAYPGGWDLQRDAYFSGIGGYGYALGGVEVVAHERPVGLARGVQWLRDTISRRILAALPGTEGGIAATLLTGGTTAIPEADRAAFRDSGLAHLLAVAGLHIGIVMGLVLGAVRGVLSLSERAALRWPCKQVAAVAALGVGATYMMMTGMHVPILRSFAMACLFTLGVLAGRRAISLRGLGIAAVAIMLIEPWEVVGVSFQMSFSAVLALIAGYSMLHPHLWKLHGTGQRHRRLLLNVTGLALTSLLAGSFSGPFAAYHFGRMQIYFVLANMLAVPLCAMWVMPLGMLALVLMPFGLEQFALIPMGWGIEIILFIARQTAALPEAVLAVPHIPAWGLCVIALSIAWIGLMRGRVRLVGAPVLVIGLLTPLMMRPPDILVSEDARLVAVRSSWGVFYSAVGAPSQFTLDSWGQYWASGPMRDLPHDDDCTASDCLLRPRADGPAALLLTGPAGSGRCGEAAVLIATEPARGRCRFVTTRYVDRFTVWRTGAQAIWLDPDGPTIVTERQTRGVRPWVPAPHRRAN